MFITLIVRRRVARPRLSLVSRIPEVISKVFYTEKSYFIYWIECNLIHIFLSEILFFIYYMRLD